MLQKVLALVAVAGLCVLAFAGPGVPRAVAGSALRQAPGPPLDPDGDTMWLAESMIPNSSNRRVATDGNSGHPMVVATNGVRHVVWFDDDEDFVYYQRYYPATNTWTAETTIFGTAFHSYQPTIALDSDGTTIHVVCFDANPNAPPPGSHIHYKRCTPSDSGNGGWDTTCVVDRHPPSEVSIEATVSCGPNHHVAIAWNEYLTGSFYACSFREILDGEWQATVRLDSGRSPDSIRGVIANAVLPNGDAYLLCARSLEGRWGWCQFWFLRRLGGVWQAPELVPVDPYSPYTWGACMAVDPTTGYPHVGYCRVSGSGPNGRQVWHNWRDDGGWHAADSVSRMKDLSWWLDYPSFAFTPQGALACVWAENTDAGPMGVAFKEWYAGSWGDQVWLYESGATNDDNASFAATDTAGNVYVVTVSCRRRGRENGWDLWYRNRVADVSGIGGDTVHGGDRPPEPGGTIIAGLDVSPNPVRGDGQLSYTLLRDCNVSIKLFDASGRLAARPPTNGFKKGVNTVRMDVSKLQRGVYFLTVAGAGDVSSTKVIIQ